MEQHAWAHPVLRWAGSKRKLLPHLIAHAPHSYRRYVEPFAGSACLFFALKPPLAVLADINSDLIAFYTLLRKHPRILSRRVHSLPTGESSYYRIRRRFNSESDPLERAVCFLYLNRYCFNGVFRTNKHGAFNVPIGSHTGDIPDASVLYRCAVALRTAKLCAADFRLTVQKARRHDFVYLDPPYSSCDRPRYGEYGYGSFQPLDLGALIDTLESLDKRGAFFMTSYCMTREARDAFKQYNVRTLRVRRHVAGFAEHRKVVQEMLITNY